MLFNTNFGPSIKIEFTIKRIEDLDKINLYRETPKKTKSGYLSRIVDEIPNTSGLYFLFKDDKLLYIGTAENIRQRINQHTQKRSVEEIASQKRINPNHFTHISWLEIEEEIDRQILETVYLNKYPTAYCTNKVYTEFDEEPTPPKDKELERPDVVQYQKRLQNSLANAVLNQ